MVINIDSCDLNYIKKWFFSYVKSFKSGDKNQLHNIFLKEEHTKRVCKEIIEIGNQLNLNEKEIILSEIIALLHDVGRFEQYWLYKTFSDSRSVDHVELGIKILKKYNVLENIDYDLQKLIFKTIGYHNRAILPQNETETCLFFSKLLRDADKLDILRVVTEYYYKKNGDKNDAIVLDLPNTPEVSENVYNDLMNKKIVDIKHVKNQNDFKLLQAGWIFDINFLPTFQRIKERHYLEMIKNALPKSKRIEEIFILINSHLNDSLKNLNIMVK